MTENRILRNQIKGRMRLSDGERTAWAEVGQQLGKKALEEVANIFTPYTILAWHRKLLAQKFDGSQQRKALGRPPIGEELEALTEDDHHVEGVYPHALGVLVATTSSPLRSRRWVDW